MKEEELVVLTKTNLGKQEVRQSVERKIDKELRECMKCKYFHGNTSRCLTTNCVKMEEKNNNAVTISKCVDCPYGRGKTVCFPCMLELLGRK